MASVGIRKSRGRYAIRFRKNVNGKQKETIATLPKHFSKQDALVLARQKETEWALGNFDPFTDDLFIEKESRYTTLVIEDYITHQIQNGIWRQGTSSYNKSQLLRTFGKDLRSDHQIAELKTKDIDTWLLNQDISNQTKHTYRAQVLAFARWCNDRKLVKHDFNPKPVKIERQKFPEIYSVNELEIICSGLKDRIKRKAAKKHTGSGHNTMDHYENYYRLLFFTGMRPGELPMIKVKDVNLADKLIYVGRNKATKTDMERAVFIFPEVMDLLKSLIARKGPNDWVIQNRTMNRVSKEFTKIRKKYLPYKKAGMYNLRHSHACWLLEQGFSIDAVAAQLGHTDPRTTRIYAVMTQRAMKNEFERLNR